MFTQSEVYLEPSQMDATLTHLGNVVAHYYFKIAGLGILGILLATTLVWENDPLDLWISFVVLGITDLAFLYLEILPGYQPLVPPIFGPVIWALAVLFAAAGLLRAERLPG